MQLTSKFNKGIHFLLCIIGIFSKYAWVIPLKDRLDESNCKPNKIWLDKAVNFIIDQ